MIQFPKIDPEIFRIGPLAVRWYGMMYLLGFGASFLLVKRQIREKSLPYSQDFVESLYSYLILGLLLGARLGYAVFYNPLHYIYHPLDVLAVWHGGMSFHGGLIGVISAGMLFCRKTGVRFLQMADLIVVPAPIGLALGRLGNFINGELYGRVTDAPWGMVFPDGGPLPRHPSQLYELFLEGIVLFMVMWAVRNRLGKPGRLSALFLMLYGSFRFFVEFFREPDAQIGYLLGYFTMGQVLCAVMIASGLAILRFTRK